MLPGEQQPISADGSPRGPDQFSRNSAYGTIAGLCTAIGSVLANVIVAHMLGVEGTGVIVFALWMAMLAAAVTDLGAQATLARYLPELTLAGRAADGDRLTALLRSALLMVRHLGEHEASTKIRNALERVYRHPEKLTKDVGGKAGTSEFADAVIEEMEKADLQPEAAQSSRA